MYMCVYVCIYMKQWKPLRFGNERATMPWCTVRQAGTHLGALAGAALSPGCSVSLDLSFRAGKFTPSAALGRHGWAIGMESSGLLNESSAYLCRVCWPLSSSFHPLVLWRTSISVLGWALGLWQVAFCGSPHRLPPAADLGKSQHLLAEICLSVRRILFKSIGIQKILQIKFWKYDNRLKCSWVN